MKRLVALTGLTLAFIGSPACAGELHLQRRIALAENLDPEAGLHLMLYTSEIDLLPQQPPGGGTGAHGQAPPGTSAGAATAANLIATLIIKGANEASQRSARDFRQRLEEELGQVNIRREFEDEIMTSFNGANFKGIALDHIDEPANMEQPGLLVNIKENNILTLSVNCYFDANMHTINMQASTKVWNKGKTKPSYLAEFRYTSPYVDSFAASDLRDKWTENNGALLIAYLREGVHEMGHMLRVDLLHSATGNSASPMNAGWIQPTNGEHMSTAFYVLDETPDRLIGRPYSPEAALLLSVPKEVSNTVQ